MQEQKIDSTLYLAIQNTYEEIEIALYHKEQILGKKNIHKNEASKTLLTQIDLLLNSNNLKLNNLSFIAANAGPGPFTTLRVVITTVNAINFAIKTPLIGINGLEAFNQEYKDENYPITIILLNAFNNDVYYSITRPFAPSVSRGIETGCKNINQLLDFLKTKFDNQKIRFIGNGTTLFESEIRNTFLNLEYIPQNNPQTCSIEAVAKMGYQKWPKKEVKEQIMPLYLKDAIKK